MLRQEQNRTEQKNNLFDRFFQTSRSKHFKDESSELGLETGKQLTSPSDGKLQLDSTKQQGSSSTLLFNRPLAVAPVAIPPNPESPPNATSPDDNPARLGRIKILVVDDNDIAQKVLKHQLNRLGHDCEIANDGVEAIEQYKCYRPQLIFMDIQMPRKDGLEATKDIRELEDEQQLPPVPIYAVSAYVRQEYQTKARELGMAGYIRKPYHLAEIDAAIQLAFIPLEPAPARFEPTI